MKFIPHLFKKDLIHLKYLLLVWLLLILAQSALGIGGHNLAAEYLQFQTFLPLLTKLISFLQGLMIIVIVPLIIQDDSIVGTTAFWFTRPISRKGLLFTKSGLVLILLAIPPLIAEIFVLASHGATAYHLFLAVPEILIEKLAFIIPFVILAALTPKFSRYALVGVIIFAVFVVVTIILAVIPMFLPHLSKYLINVKIYKNPSLEASVGIAKDLYVFLIGLILIAHQFLTRHTARTIKYLVVAFLVMTCFTRLWNWDFLKEVSVVKSSSAMSEPLSVDFDTQYIVVSDEPRMQKKDVREKTISIKQTVKGLPVGQFTILREMEDVQMEYPDGTVLKSKYVSTYKRETPYNKRYMLPIQAALKDVKLLNPYEKKFSSTEIFSLDESDFHQFKNRSGTYSACADFDIYEYKIVSQFPLKQGSIDSYGSEQIVVYDILERPNAISVIINEKKINLLFDRSTKKKSRSDMAQDMFSEYNHVYLIVNKKRHEAFLAEEGADLYANMMAAYGPTRLEAVAKQFDFTNLNDRSGPLPKIDKEWLANAELVKIDAVKIGTAQINFTVEGFSLPSQSTATSEEFDEIDRRLRMQDKQMKERYPE
jgi:hypothetical protein